MTDTYFNRMLEEIYANFGRTRPAYGSPMYNNLHRRLCEGLDAIPDEAAGEIAYAFAEYDSLPQNIGKAIRAEFSRWKTNHPERIVKRAMCPQCNSGSAGWSYAHDANGKNYLLRCTCNTELDPTAPDAPVATRQYLEQHGMTLGKCVNPLDPDGKEPSATRDKLAAQFGLGKTHTVRREHLQAREDAGVYGFDAF